MRTCLCLLALIACFARPASAQEPVEDAQVVQTGAHYSSMNNDVSARQLRELVDRLEQAERRLKDLEAGPLDEDDPDDEAKRPFLPPRLIDLMFVYDPEIAAAREQQEEEAKAVAIADRMLFEPTDDPKIPGFAKPRQKRWYEKFAMRGYTQIRDNEVTWQGKDSAPATHIGDRSIGNSQNFFLRRARIILQGDINDYVYMYLQPDFANQPPGSPDSTFFIQLRDWYFDLYFDKQQVNRLRVGLSKVPYGWENMQSSSNRGPLDRNDALNSAVRNERDFGMFYYWTPVYAQKTFRYVLAENLKGSGNYGVFGLGVYNGQGGSFIEQNNNLHTIARISWPFQFENGQILELSTQAYTGRYTVLSSPIRPLGTGPSTRPENTLETGNRKGIRDQRIAWSAIWYPQPIGFQAEWNIGDGPGLNDEQTAVVERALNGGYLMAISKLDTSTCGVFFPFVRWQYYKGGIKPDRNAPYALINETEVGVEWQITPATEFTMEYTFTNRTNTQAVDQPGVESYRQFQGQLLRMQLQINY